MPSPPAALGLGASVEGAASANCGSLGTTIHLDGVSKRFEDRCAVQALVGVDLKVSAGEFVALLGPSGCGKSTLLRIIGGLLATDTGTVSVGGQAPRLARATKQFAFVPQTPALLPWKTVRQNVRVLVETNRRVDARSVLNADAAVELLRAVGLSEFLHAFPGQLSGGMQQRVSVVRAFMLDAPVLLMDEPFGALDEITRWEMCHLLLELCGRSEKTVVFVTHSVAEAVILADRVAVLGARPGRIVAVESITLGRPRSPGMEDSTQFHQHVRRVRRHLRAEWSP